MDRALLEDFLAAHPHYRQHVTIEPCPFCGGCGNVLVLFHGNRGQLADMGAALMRFGQARYGAHPVAEVLRGAFVQLAKAAQASNN